MKCPQCGNELSGTMICSKCGGKVKIPGRDIEVEYKEFTVSEFLEIRKKQQTSRMEGSGESGAAEKDKLLSPQTPVSTTGQAMRVAGTKKILVAFFLILIILGLIAGTYYLLRFLFQQ